MRHFLLSIVCAVGYETSPVHYELWVLLEYDRYLLQ